jgi:hypothetical protein
MDDVKLEYSKERGTWNVIVNGEWYYESEDYEQAENVFLSFFWDVDESETDEPYPYE